MFRLSLAAGIFLLSATAVSAQTWPVCFDAEGVLSPQGFRNLRAARAAFEEAPAWRASATLYREALYSPDDRVAVERTNTALIEAIRAGFSPAIAIVTAYEPSAEGCLAIEVKRHEAPQPLATWHYHGVFFESGSAVVDQKWDLRLRIYAATYQPGTRVILQGYADTLGSPADNLALSRMRAEAVADAFIRLGVRAEDIEITAYGETNLMKPSADEASESLNRRVWIDMRMRPR
jgi:outer membrane protein OmpA-like peptidoglycan-associated protein